MRPATYRIRSPEEDDWPAIRAVADAAAPGRERENDEWLRHRRGFPVDRYPRRHYVVVGESTAAVIGYGAIEGSATASFRVFVVMDDALLGVAGPSLYDRLAGDLRELGARRAWVREDATDAALLDFFRGCGLDESERRQVIGGHEIVVLERQL